MYLLHSSIDERAFMLVNMEEQGFILLLRDVLLISIFIGELYQNITFRLFIKSFLVQQLIEEN
jgi:hypothetical protein